MLWMNRYVVPYIFLTSVFSGLDPLHLILKGDSNFGIANFLLFLFRVVFTFRYAREMYLAVDAFLLSTTMVVCSTTDFMQRLIRRKTALNRLDPDVAVLYRELQIWNGHMNQNFCYFAVPPLIFFGLAFIVLGAYGTVRMAGKMSWIFYPMVPMLTLGSASSAVTILPYAAKVYENSAQYLRKTNQNVSSKYDRRLVMSWRPLSISVGPFGHVDKGLCTEFARYFTECTCNMLITF